jgi:PTH1 family peptidyl-tRNA hydrolase
MSSWLVVGLGNPGANYANTRHNIGYLVLDELAQRMGVSFAKHRRAHADVADGRLVGQRVELLRSRTYMNESGGPVKAAADYAKIPLEQVIVIQDELDIPFGAVRLKVGGGDGGHNGIKSIKKSLGSADFTRVRAGIDRPPGRQDPADYVLKPFSSAQRQELANLIVDVADAVEVVLTDGLGAAQQKYHSG